MKWWQLKKRDADLERELRSDLELEAEEQRERGLSKDEAGYAARRALGNTTLIREQAHEAWGWARLEYMYQDLRFAFRQLRRSPGFAAASIFTLALGIGASTSIFSVADAVLLRPLPYPRPEQLVRVWEQMPNGHRPNLAESNYEDFVAQNRTFSQLAAYDFGLVSLSGGSEPARANISGVSSQFFPVFGVQPYRGRLFTAGEQRPHGTPVMIVSYGYWQRYLGSSADLSKFHLDLEGGSYQVVGVMPPGFDYPAGVAAWIPRESIDPPEPSRTGHNWQVIGRVRDGVTVGQARADLSAIAHRIRSQYGSEVDLTDAAVQPLSATIVGDVRTALLTLLGAVGLLLVVACANVAGLLMARAAARRKELAVRAALGAARSRLVQQFLAESFALAFGAGVLGVVIAVIGVRTLPAVLPADLPRQQGIAINPGVLLFALAATALIAIGLGLFAAWRAGGPDLREAMSTSSQSHTGASATQRLRSVLVVGEIATTLVILIGAGLLGRSFLRLISTNPGFRSESLITMEFSPPVPMRGMNAGEVARQVQQLDDIMARLRTIPGVQSLGLASGVPVALGDNLPEGTFLLLNGHNPPADFDQFGHMALNHAQTGHALYGVAGEDYFTTLGIPLMRGRLFGPQDGLDAPNVALISEALARRSWPNQDPIGKVIEFGNMDGNLKPLTIVGVVGDVRARGLDAPPDSVIYVDYRQRGMNVNSTPTILVRTSAPEGEIVAPARAVFRQLAPEVPVKFSTFAEQMNGWLADRRFVLLLVGLFAAAALVLASVGLYGVVAFFVTRRTQEIGIRMAIGAQRGDVLRMVLVEGSRLAGLGIAIGVVASLAVTRLLSSLLFGVSSMDPVTFIAVAAILSGVALAASFIPARRAMRVDPVKALRYE
ncbi:MAG TPA: ABC transporter permease [Terracidiphilus sp.]|nr:ABC transporter permease [Terracidiphilus sp.]